MQLQMINQIENYGLLKEENKQNTHHKPTTVLQTYLLLRL